MGTNLMRMIWTRKYLLLGLGLLLLIALGLLPAAARPAEQAATAPPAQDLAQAKDIAPDCTLLSKPDVVSRLSIPALPWLLAQCGLGPRPAVPAVAQTVKLARSPFAPFAPLGVDVQENNQLLDPNPHYHQDESDLAINGSTICSLYNDSGSSPASYMGFSVSTDGGVTYTDRGNFSSSYGDPGVIYRAADGFFYVTEISTAGGLGLRKSTDNCQTFGPSTLLHSGSGDDKEMIRVDNNPASAFYGRMYVCWTNFNVGEVIQVTWSSNGGTTWSSPVSVGTGSLQQACWPGVAPNGDVYVVYITGYTTGTNNIQMARSTNGGVSFAATTNVATSITEPGVSVSCGGSPRPTMNAYIRTWAMPQVAVAPSGRVHVSYTRKDGSDRGNIYYSHSDDNGTTWSAPVRINDDSTTNDQWHPTIAVNASGTVVISWYDRREDTGNTLFKRYAALSFDDGNTWEPNVAVGDVSTTVPQLYPTNFDPNIAVCYMGDYDAVAIDTTNVYIQWSDNRNPEGSLAGQPDMFLDRIPLSTPTPTDTATPGPSPTPSNTPTPTSTPTCTPQASWSDQAPLPVTRIRAGASAYTPNGNIYLLGGRQDDTTYVNTIYQYTPSSNTWLLKTATLPDLSSANAAVAELLDPTGDHIYVVGGNSSPTTVTGSVRIYDPVADVVTTLDTDPWPGGTTYLPGGWAVYSNTLYIFGGFQPSTSTTNAIWKFDPMAAAGTKWSQLSTVLSLARAYIGTTELDGYIYLVGGSQWLGGALTNETLVERFNPADNSITTIASLLVGSSNFQAFAYDTSTGYPTAGKVYAPGGVWPTSVNTMQVYDPGTDTWTMGVSLTHASRNYGRGEVNGAFYAIGGYDESSAPTMNTQEYVEVPCATPTPTETPLPPTETPTETPVAPTETATATLVAMWYLYLPIIMK